MPKAQVLELIGDMLRRRNMEVICKDFPELQEPEDGMRPYAIAYDTDSYNAVVVRAWSGSDYAWPLDITRITKTRLEKLYDRVVDLAQSL